MKDNFANDCVTKIKGRYNDAVSQIVSQWKDVKPFGAKELTPKEGADLFFSLNANDIESFIQRNGQGVFDKWRDDAMRYKNGLGST
jgi:hypothetical protein